MPPTSYRHRLLAEPPFPGSQLSMTVLRLGTVVLSGSLSKGTVSASEYLSESPGCSCRYRGTSPPPLQVLLKLQRATEVATPWPTTSSSWLPSRDNKGSAAAAGRQAGRQLRVLMSAQKFLASIRILQHFHFFRSAGGGSPPHQQPSAESPAAKAGSGSSSRRSGRHDL